MKRDFKLLKLLGILLLLAGFVSNAPAINPAADSASMQAEAETSGENGAQDEPTVGAVSADSQVDSREEISLMASSEKEQVKDKKNAPYGNELIGGSEPGESTPVSAAIPQNSSLEIGSLPVEISGFGDLYSTIHQRKEEGDDFRIGQMEIDLETNIDSKIAIGASIAYDSDDQAFALGAFTIDFHIFGSDGEHFRPVDGINHSGILAGQFDVPFGIGWEEYASIDNRLVSSPVAVEYSHHAWNDYGIQGYLDTKWFNAVVFGVNGFGYQAGYHSDGHFLGYDGFGYDIDDQTLNLRDTNVKMSAGGRLGLKPFQKLEIGGSYAGFLNTQNKNDMTLFGIDSKFDLEPFRAKGEYIIHKLGLSGDNPATNTGYYGEGLYSFGNYFLVGRYSEFNPDIITADDLKQLSAGIGWVVRDACELRLEQQFNTGKHNDITFSQLVVGF